ncbi:MAG: ATP-binding protein [Acidobacteriota bacterium]
MLRLPFKPRSFRARLTLNWTLVFGVLLTLTLIGIYFSLSYNLKSALEANLRTLALTEVASAIDEYQGVHLHDFNHPNEQHIEKYVQILTPAGDIVNQSPQLVSRAPLITREVMDTALSGQALFTKVSLDDHPGYGVSLLAEKDNQRYVFVVATPEEPMQAVLGSLKRNLIIIGLMALLATALVGYRLATLALRPVDLIARRARVIGFDHLRLRLEEPQTDDELGRLTNLLNDMLDRLYSLIESHQRFAADASHELRSPLAALRGQIEVALRQSRSAEHYRAVLESCLEDVSALTRLTEDLLELARADAKQLNLDLYEVELKPLVEETLSQYEPDAEKKQIALSANIPANFAVIADPAKLKRLLTNLISNAIAYSKPAGGRIDISAGASDKEVWIEVRDNGIGIGDEQKARVFERFWRADKARTLRSGGVGLGLAICKGIVAAHGGEISVKSSLNEGSCFRICLPKYDSN